MIRDLLFPTTDAGVLAQIVVLALLAGGAIAAAWRHPEVRVLAAGLSLLGAALIGLRALH